MVRPERRGHADIVESIRVLRIAYCSARETRTRLALQIRDLIITARRFVSHRPPTLPIACPVCEVPPRGSTPDPHEATGPALKTLSRRYQELSEEMAELTKILDQLTKEANPALRAAKGVGVDVASILLVAAGSNCQRLRNESAFAAMCGVSPKGVST